jgi:small subunit ribosomal protein S16
MGAKKRPFYRFVVADSRSPRDGRFIEILGHYNPIANPTELVVDKEKALYWLAQGAQPSEPVKRLFKKAGVLEEGAVGE